MSTNAPVDLTITNTSTSGYTTLTSTVNWIADNVDKRFRVKIVNPEFVTSGATFSTARTVVRDLTYLLMMNGPLGGQIRMDSLIQSIRNKLPCEWQRVDFANIPAEVLDEAKTFWVEIWRDYNRLVFVEPMVHSLYQAALSNALSTT